MLQLVGADVSGRSSGVAGEGGRLTNLPVRRPSQLPVAQVKCNCLDIRTWNYANLGDIPLHIWAEGHFQVRYVYWDGYQPWYGQWFKRGIEYPIFSVEIFDAIR